MLITIAEYAQYAGLSLPLSNQSQIEALIEAASAFIEAQLGRDLYVCSPSPLEAVEKHHGNDDFRMWMDNAPIDSVDTIEYWNGTDWQDVSDLGMTFAFEEDTGKVYFPERYVFHKGVDNWRITYTYGYDDLPNDIKYAVYLMVRHYDIKQSRAGIKSESDGEQSFTYELDAKPSSEVANILAKYIRF